MMDGGDTLLVRYKISSRKSGPGLAVEFHRLEIVAKFLPAVIVSDAAITK
jgi:hypothetical protein